MLPILGMLMLVLWLLNGAFHPPAGSVVHVSLILACVLFVTEFIRSRAAALMARGNHEPSQVVAAPQKVPHPLASESSPSKVTPS